MPERSARRRALDFSLQLLVVVLGVTISLALDEWRTSRAEDRAAVDLTDRLVADLEADLEELDRGRARIDRMAMAYQALLDAGDLPDDSTDVYLDLAVSYMLFLSHDEAYEGMRQTGTSSLLNADWRADLIRLHTRVYGRAREWDDISRQFVLDRMIPYIEANGPELEGTTVNGGVWAGSSAFRALEDDVHFRNLLRTNLLFKQTQSTVYGLTRDQIE
ncbi:hypothetical protein, partial [Rubrivirga sp.]|uniref:hypothetical protein n=1 Tax=Rubrivirga sp. TaxID=1885344 RepID=UPI003C70F001